MEHKRDFVKKLTPFGHIQWAYLGQLWTFLLTLIYISNEQYLKKRSIITTIQKKMKIKSDFFFLYSNFWSKYWKFWSFINAHLEVAVKCIPTKPRTKYRVPCKTLAVREKCAHVKTASKSYRKNPTNTNVLKLKKTQYQLAGIYLKEQTDTYKIRLIRLETQWKIGKLR